MIEQLSLSQKYVTSEEAVSHNSLYYQRISIARSQVSFYAIVTCIWSKCHVSCSGFRETLGLILTRVTRPSGFNASSRLCKRNFTRPKF